MIFLSNCIEEFSVDSAGTLVTLEGSHFLLDITLLEFPLELVSAWVVLFRNVKLSNFHVGPVTDVYEIHSFYYFITKKKKESPWNQRCGLDGRDQTLNVVRSGFQVFGMALDPSTTNVVRTMNNQEDLWDFSLYQI